MRPSQSQKHRVGLTVEEHRTTSTTLQTVVKHLQQMLSLLRSRYPKTHAGYRQCSNAATNAQALLVTLENQAHAEHPDQPVRYLVSEMNQPTASTEALMHALATTGENVEID